MLSLSQACEALLSGKLIIYPTETFYAIGGIALDADAVGKVFAVKQRGFQYPLPVVIGSYGQLKQITYDVSPTAQKLMDTFWPGALSIVLPAKPEVPDLLTANLHRIAVRFSSHPAAQQLCRETGKVLVASSANITGAQPMVDCAQLDPDVVSKTAGVFFLGPTPAGGLPSTIVDVVPTPDGDLVRVLRQGAIPVDLLVSKGFAAEIMPT